MLEGARSGALADVVAEELAAVLAEFDERAVSAELRAALAHGRIGGAPGALDTGGVEVHGLDAALAYAASLGCRTPAARALLASAHVVRRLRAAVVAAPSRPGGGIASSGCRSSEVDAALRAAYTIGGGAATLAVVAEAADEAKLPWCAMTRNWVVWQPHCPLPWAKVRYRCTPTAHLTLQECRTRRWMPFYPAHCKWRHHQQLSMRCATQVSACVHCVRQCYAVIGKERRVWQMRWRRRLMVAVRWQRQLQGKWVPHRRGWHDCGGRQKP